MAFHELVDFCLHVPANALLFTLFLGLALRIASWNVAQESAIPARRFGVSRAAAVGMIGTSAALIALALGQKGLAYPYDICAATTPKEARDVVLTHPASAKAHVALLDLAGPDMTREMRLNEIAAAVWLDPTDPSARDMYAKMLVRAGRRDEALEQVTQSVFNSPGLGAHFYLNRQLIPWLLPSEQKAAERGFKEAVAAHYPGAVDGLGSFYDALGRLSEESRVYAASAAGARVGNERARYLTAAARAEIKEGDTDAAETSLRQAIQSAPADTAVYAELMTGIYGPQRNLSAAVSAAKEGLRNGAEPGGLYIALSSAAQMSENGAIAEKSLLEALRFDPSFQTVMRVGQYYLQNGQFDRAASMLQNAVEIRPSSAEAFYLLGVAHERSYRYPDADKAYAQAAILAPLQFRQVYAAFRRRMDASQTKG
jgi:Flp pilus assembly protein TadD